MSIFNSSREKRYWFYAMMVLAAIFATLFLGRPLQNFLQDETVQLIFFLSGMLLTGLVILFHGLKVQPEKIELVIWLGILAVYGLLLFRLSAPERSHLMEYSVLAIFVHKAFVERFRAHEQWIKPVVLAFITCVGIGILDECIQILLPHRVFDPLDILFNTIVILMALAGSSCLNWLRRKAKKRK